MKFSSSLLLEDVCFITQSMYTFAGQSLDEVPATESSDMETKIVSLRIISTITTREIVPKAGVSKLAVRKIVL